MGRDGDAMDRLMDDEMMRPWEEVRNDEEKIVDKLHPRR